MLCRNPIPGHGGAWLRASKNRQKTRTAKTGTSRQKPGHPSAKTGNVSQATTFAADANSSIARSVGGSAYQDNQAAALSSLHPSALGAFGGSAPHQNMQPFLVLTFIIALVGVFPPRS